MTMKKIVISCVSALILAGCAQPWDGVSPITANTVAGPNSPPTSQLSDASLAKLKAYGLQKCRKRYPGAAKSVIDGCIAKGLRDYDNTIRYANSPRGRAERAAAEQERWDNFSNALSTLNGCPNGVCPKEEQQLIFRGEPVTCQKSGGYLYCY